MLVIVIGGSGVSTQLFRLFGTGPLWELQPPIRQIMLFRYRELGSILRRHSDFETSPTVRARCVDKIDDYPCRQAFRHFMNLLNQATYGNAFRRHGKRLRVLPVLERGEVRARSLRPGEEKTVRSRRSTVSLTA
jgi:hypothetical protein